VESSIQLPAPAEKPENYFIKALRELLRKGKIEDKHFAFAPVKKGEGDYYCISKANSIPNNMTVLSNKHFNISYQGDKNPFKKQKVWGKNKKDKDKEGFVSQLSISVLQSLQKKSHQRY
jgi:hypothetical protein